MSEKYRKKVKVALFLEDIPPSTVCLWSHLVAVIKNLEPGKI